MNLEEILQMGKFCLTNMHSVLMADGHEMKEPYKEWIASSWTPRPETGDGDTPMEAIRALCEKLGIVIPEIKTPTPVKNARVSRPRRKKTPDSIGV